MEEFNRDEGKTSKRSPLKDMAVIVFTAAVIFALLSGFGGLIPVERENRAKDKAFEIYSESDFLLDTFCTVSIYGDESEAESAEEILSETMERLRRLDDLLNPSTEGSDTWRINHRTENTVEISETTGRMLESIRELEREAGGDFNVAIEPLSSLWNFDERSSAPSEEEINEALSHVHFEGWNVEKKDSSNEYIFVTDKDDLKVDPGAFAKGFIADELKAFLKEKKLSSALINLGGNVLCLGSLPDGEAFKIGLKKPEKGSDENIEILSVNDRSVVTAGIYERSFEEDGVLYHHILDTETGYPVQNDLAAVSIVGDSSLCCDFLSTTLFIKGEEEGRTFLCEFNEQRGLTGDEAYEAYFIKKDGSLER